jgi:outer membrane lipoprotein carrier protein
MLAATWLGSAEALTPAAFSAFLKGFQGASAVFEQTVSDRSGKILQKGEGTLLIARPGKFRWQYQKPHRQLVVADGRKIWIYDEDLRQVTVKRQDAAMSGSPALLLAGGDDPAGLFELRELPMQDGLDWIEAIPRNTDAGFTTLRLGFGNGLPARLSLADSFGNETRIVLRDFRRNPPLDGKLFAFTPPAGVDLVGE